MRETEIWIPADEAAQRKAISLWAFWRNFRQYRERVRAMSRAERQRFAWCMRQGFLAPLAFALTDPAILAATSGAAQTKSDDGASTGHVPTRSDDAAMTDPLKREKAAPSAPDFSDMPFARLQDYFRKARIAPE